MDKLSEMPLITVEQIARFKEAAIALEKHRDDLLTIIKWANNHGGLGYSIHAEFEKAIAKAGDKT